MTHPDEYGDTQLELDPRDLAEVQRILREQVPDMEVWAFGSRARHCAKPYSDLDLALITEQPLPLDRWASIHDAFAQSDLPMRVDLVDWATTSAAFRQIIATNKWVLQRPSQA